MTENPGADNMAAAAIESQFEDFETRWTVIGDPASPEQKPKVTLSGYVFNEETGEPLKEAIVFVEELQTGAATDSVGRYEVSLPQGRYEIIFQSVGLRKASRKLKLYASGQMDVRLETLILQMEEVVVTADRKESIRSVQMGVEALKSVP